MTHYDEEIQKLREQLLLVAKETQLALNWLEYKLAGIYLKGDELTRFYEHLDKKRETTMEEIEKATTVEKIILAGLEFRKEVFTYLTEKKVDTADKAMDIAHSFIKKYSPVALPLKAVREGDIWLVDIDVGVLAVKIAKVQVDARTGDILSYEIPPK